MPTKRVLLTMFPLPVLAILGVSLALYPFNARSNDAETLYVNTKKCDRAREALREADQCFAEALAGLRRVGVARDRLVIGDRHLTSRYIQQIAAIRERLHQVSEEADGMLARMVLPEINPADED